jgi:3-deoxy-7-phosphoheptulonate synthase
LAGKSFGFTLPWLACGGLQLETEPVPQVVACAFIERQRDTAPEPMIVVPKPNISKREEIAVLKEIRKLGYKPHVMRGVERRWSWAIGDDGRTIPWILWRSGRKSREDAGAEEYKLAAAKRIRPILRSTCEAIWLRKKDPGHGRPRSVEDERQLLTTAHAVRAAGATILRGGAFKPRTSPYEFQGLGEKGLKLLAKARRQTGLAVITELLSQDHAELVAEYTDIIQIGARNAQNFQLIIAAARTGKPVLLKRGLSMRIEEWLLAGEYVLANENPNLIFCERGIRTFETYTRNTLDLSAIPIIKNESHCPIVIDPSQGAGRADLVAAMCKGAVAMGADALLIEVHPNPAEALSDGAQQITLESFTRLMEELKPFLAAAGRE